MTEHVFPNAGLTDFNPEFEQPPSQTWRTFLVNHIGQIVAADLFVVPTATYRLLFVLVILGHERLRVVQVAVTDHPTAEWTSQQPLTTAAWRSSRIRFTIGAWW